MSNILLLHAPAWPVESISWIKWNTAKQQAIDSGELAPQSLSQLQPLSASAITLLAIPGQHIRAFNVPLPSKKKAILNGVQFLIEEHLSTPIEQLHVATGHFTEKGIQAFALSHEEMQYWTQLIKNSGLDVRYLTPDYQLIANTQTTNLLWQDNTQVLIYSDQVQASVNQATMAILAPRLAASTPDFIYSGLLENTPEGMQHTPQITSLTEQLARNFSHKRPPVNLLQSQYQQQNPLLGYLQTFRRPLIALGVMLCILFGGLVLENAELKQSVKQLNTAMSNLYRETFPQSTRIINPLSQMRAQLNQQSSQKSGTALLEWLYAAAPLLDKHKVTLLSLRFSQSPPTLRLQLQANDYNAMEQLNAELLQIGLKTELGTLIKNQGNVSGLLTVIRQ